MPVPVFSGNISDSRGTTCNGGPYSRQRMAPENSPANRTAVVRVVHLVSEFSVKNPVDERLYFSSFEIGCAMGAYALGAGAKAQPDCLAESCAYALQFFPKQNNCTRKSTLELHMEVLLVLLGKHEYSFRFPLYSFSLMKHSLDSNSRSDSQLVFPSN